MMICILRTASLPRKGSAGDGPKELERQEERPQQKTPTPPCLCRPSILSRSRILRLITHGRPLSLRTFHIRPAEPTPHASKQPKTILGGWVGCTTQCPIFGLTVWRPLSTPRANGQGTWGHTLQICRMQYSRSRSQHTTCDLHAAQGGAVCTYIHICLPFRHAVPQC